jgi:hypothetical protein
MKPDEWNARFNAIRQRLIDHYSLTAQDDAEMLHLIIYSTKPGTYQIQLTVFKGQLVHHNAELKLDPDHKTTITLETVQVKLCHNYQKSEKLNPLSIPTPSTHYPKPFNKDCSFCNKKGQKHLQFNHFQRMSNII